MKFDKKLKTVSSSNKTVTFSSSAGKNNSSLLRFLLRCWFEAEHSNWSCFVWLQVSTNISDGSADQPASALRFSHLLMSAAGEEWMTGITAKLCVFLQGCRWKILSTFLFWDVGTLGRYQSASLPQVIRSSAGSQSLCAVCVEVLLAEFQKTGQLFAIKALKKRDIVSRDEVDRCVSRFHSKH